MLGREGTGVGVSGYEGILNNEGKSLCRNDWKLC